MLVCWRNDDRGSVCFGGNSGAKEKESIFQFFRSLAQFGVGIHNILAKADAPHS
jgi:hypothetical protein